MSPAKKASVPAERQPPGPTRFHIWMPDNRSLCDLRAHAAAALVEEGNPANLKACGSCVVLAGVIEEWRLAMVERAKDLIEPEPLLALENLRRTRWADAFNVDMLKTSMQTSGWQYDGSHRAPEGDPNPPKPEDGAT